eukprot:CAMPEP_0198498564 /NCGR_PEP_ID=MMETSP1462-20131121/7085_1 /TAXON_ID=1333877 /ORGANISM="Brandtodinium nutriculum, Strain RCC3387" /LENGTH=82 /DNA_ID=CAMNT_0044227487 /DNA_START=444 /DNA_END=689 /DNA_ORIENTATION=-
MDGVGQAILVGVALLCAPPHHVLVGGFRVITRYLFEFEALVDEVEAPVRHPERLLRAVTRVVGVGAVRRALPPGRAGAGTRV